MTPDLPPDNPPPWGFFEWAVTTLGFFFASAVAFIWRMNTKISIHDQTLQTHADRLQDLSGQSVSYNMNMREDINQIRLLIETRFDQISSRLDRIDTRVDGINKNVG
jgi:hypothetical protein